MEHFATVLTAALGLAGTVFGSAMAYRQWRRDKHDSLYRRFQEERLSVYGELWDLVEGMSIESRHRELSKKERSDLIRSVNSFMLRKGLFFDDSDRRLVQDYLDAATDVHNRIHFTGNQADIDALAETRLIVPEELKEAVEYSDAFRKAMECRVKLIARIHNVIKL